MSLLTHMERWRDIADFEGLYQVSTCGRVKSLNYNRTGKEKILKQEKIINGYLRVCLSKDGKEKHYLVHRLVAQAFIPNPLNLPCVNHKNEGKENFVSNLEWCSYQYNLNYGTARERMTKNMTGPYKSKKVLCVETHKIYHSTIDAQRQTGISQGNISSCCNGKRKTAGKFHWQYAND